MKRSTILYLLILIFFISGFTYANLGPSYWEGEQSSEILTIDKNTPIEVIGENLIFDFNDEEFYDYGLPARITANYKMLNNSEKEERVQMAFPYSSSSRGFNLEDVYVKVDSEQVEYEVFFVKAIEDNVDFDYITKSVSSSEYSPRNYNLDDVGTLYEYKLASDRDEDVEVEISYSNDENKSKVIFHGFNGYENMEGEIRLTTRVYEERKIEIFVIGEDVDLELKVYSDRERENETDEYTAGVEKEKITVRDYITKEVESLEKEFAFTGDLAENQFLNLFAKEFDESIEMHGNNLGSDSLFRLPYEGMIFVLIYEVDFPALDIKNIKVSYNTFGSMDIRKSKEPIYTFDYILNPAKNWKSFKDLNIEINPPSSNPYIIDTSIELSRQENGNYTGYFEELPDEDLLFSLYYKEKISALDKIRGFTSRNIYMFYFILLPILILIIIGFILFRIFKKSRKK